MILDKYGDYEVRVFKNKWILGEKHEIYGEVVMMASFKGEAYRFFDSGDGCVAMIPLNFLEELQ
jgi:hypothetical protein